MSSPLTSLYHSIIRSGVGGGGTPVPTNFTQHYPMDEAEIDEILFEVFDVDLTIEWQVFNGYVGMASGIRKLGDASLLFNDDMYIKLDVAQNQALWKVSTFTYSKWIKIGTPSETKYIAQSYSEDLNRAGWLWYVGTNGKITFRTDPNTTPSVGAGSEISSTTAVDDDNFQFLTIVKNGSSMKIFVAGILDASGTETNPIGYSSANLVLMGARQLKAIGSPAFGRFVGNQDNSKWWSGIALSDAQVLALYNSENSGTP